MNKTSPTATSLNRQTNESELEWKKRLTKHIEKSAPAKHRYYVRNGKPGVSWQRWIVPGIFGVMSLFFIISGYLNNADIRTLNSTAAAQGEFVVERLQRIPRHGVLEENQSLGPIVTIRGEAIMPLYSHNKAFAVGEPVTLKYSQHGKVVASFLDENGNIPATSYLAMFTMGLLFAGMASSLV